MTMTMGQAIQTVFRKYAEFGGRASRSEFWWWILFTVLVAGAFTSFPSLFFPIGGGVPAYGGWLAALWGIVILVPTLAVAVRRLRDARFDWAHIFWLLVFPIGVIVLIILWAQPTREPVAAAVPRVGHADDTGRAPGPAPG